LFTPITLASLDVALFANWDEATWVCSIKGHVTPAARVARVDERVIQAGLALEINDQCRLSRCLRCDAWIAGPRPTNPDLDRLPPLDQLDLPRRGKALRQAIILRVIAIERGIHSVGFALVALLGLLLKTNLVGIQSTARQLVDSLSNAQADSGRVTNHSILVQEGARVLKLQAHTLDVLIAAAVAYCIVEGVEAVGLWRERRWAEYLTVVATAGFLPLEIHELLKRLTAVRVGALVVNIAILVYLVYAKRLFGLARWRPQREAEAAQLATLFCLPGQQSPADGIP
jgi:uncharacterized membrane protein (DUF2068 family)